MIKELTYEDWQKNSTPRMMWVWNDDETKRMKRKVLFIFNLPEGREWKVSALSPDETCTNIFKHCAEIGKTRRMTNKELARWLREHPSREYKYHNRCSCRYVYSYHTYDEINGDKEIDKDIVVREDYGEWKEPLIEVNE